MKRDTFFSPLNQKKWFTQPTKQTIRLSYHGQICRMSLPGRFRWPMSNTRNHEFHARAKDLDDSVLALVQVQWQTLPFQSMLPPGVKYSSNAVFATFTAGFCSLDRPSTKPFNLSARIKDEWERFVGSSVLHHSLPSDFFCIFIRDIKTYEK